MSVQRRLRCIAVPKYLSDKLISPADTIVANTEKLAHNI